MSNEQHPDQEEVRQERSQEDPAADETEALRGRLEEAEAKADEHYQNLLRLQAELDNLHKRTARELQNAHKYALEKFVSELLPVRDSMEMGLYAAQEGTADIRKLVEGMELTLKMLHDAMAKFGVEQINPEGEKFDPDAHQAMSMQEAPEVPPNTVMNVMQKGYRLNDRLLRPALVMVSRGGKAPAAEEKPEEGGRPGENAK
ncbi:MAG TPA: nucleotide exchange factor GrpE [Thiotrichales bacterium]|nr:nucleotide exchange factor GrpE [Thiotrichales bacterium]